VSRANGRDRHQPQAAARAEHAVDLGEHRGSSGRFEDVEEIRGGGHVEACRRERQPLRIGGDQRPVRRHRRGPLEHPRRVVDSHRTLRLGSDRRQLAQQPSGAGANVEQRLVGTDPQHRQQ